MSGNFASFYLPVPVSVNISISFLFGRRVRVRSFFPFLVSRTTRAFKRNAVFVVTFVFFVLHPYYFISGIFPAGLSSDAARNPSSNRLTRRVNEDSICGYSSMKTLKDARGCFVWKDECGEYVWNYCTSDFSFEFVLR